MCFCEHMLFLLCFFSKYLQTVWDTKFDHVETLRLAANLEFSTHITQMKTQAQGAE